MLKELFKQSPSYILAFGIGVWTGYAHNGTINTLKEQVSPTSVPYVVMPDDIYNMRQLRSFIRQYHTTTDKKAPLWDTHE